jgi:uncharacterized protein (TIGR02246 family)
MSPEADVRDFEAAVMRAYNGHDPARAARFYADDAFVHVPGQRHARGRAALTENIARFMQDPNFALSYENEATQVSASGDLAYTRGRLHVTYTDRGSNAARMVDSNYLLVMRPQRDLGWQVIEDVSF